jgi:ElaB/YqjD/DUF883 family membrane-anchored ribosome-binding protein
MDNPTTTPHSPADRAQTVGHDTKQAAQNVASTAGDEAKRTTREAKEQARQLWGQTRTDLTEQAATQQTRAATGLRELADQLTSMAERADDGGMARGLVDDVARRAGDAAGWLDQRDPGSLLEEARGFARRRPMAFLAAAAGLGVVAGRLSRSLVDEAKDSNAPSSTAPAAGSPAAGGAAPMFTEGTVPMTPAGTATTGTTTEDVSGLPRTSQPLAPDLTPSPIDSEGRMTVGDGASGIGR